MSNDASVLRLLREGEIVSHAPSPVGSNYTFLVKIRGASGQEVKAIYKPRDGEVPLWDFESGTLYKREYAAYLFSQVLGWRFIPETVVRDGPYGIGSVQRFVHHGPNSFYHHIHENHREELRAIHCFDIIANNADRKAVHLFRDAEGKVWGIDHGLTFNHVPKLRTVVWDFWGEPLTPPIQEAMEAFLKSMKSPTGQVKEMLGLLHPVEVEALGKRMEWIAEMGAFPEVRRY